MNITTPRRSPTSRRAMVAARPCWRRSSTASGRRRCGTGCGRWALIPLSVPRACFPTEMKAAPLLRAWLHRCASSACAFMSGIAGWAGRTTALCVWRRRWAKGRARFSGRARAGRRRLGQAGFGRCLGAGAGRCRRRGRALQPANCGFDVDWSPVFRERFAGAPVKPVTGRVTACCGGTEKQGEFNITETGIGWADLRAVGAAARCAGQLRRGDAVAGSGAGTQRGAAGQRTGAAAWSRFARQPSAPARRPDGRQRQRCCVNVARRQRWRNRGCWRRRSKALPLRLKAPRPIDEGNQQCRRCMLRGAGWPRHVAGAARRFRCRRNAGLGSTDRWLSAHGMLRERPACRAGRGRLAGRRQLKFGRQKTAEPEWPQPLASNFSSVASAASKSKLATWFSTSVKRLPNAHSAIRCSDA